MSYRATIVTNVVYSTASVGTFDQAPGTAPLVAGAATIYPQAAMYNPVLKSQLGVEVILGTPSGQTVAFAVVRNDSSRTITGGDICEMASTIGSGSILYVDGVMYPRTPAGLDAAFDAITAAGVGGRIVVPPGSDITWDNTTEIVYAGNDLWLDWDPSVTLTLPSGAHNVNPIAFTGAGGGTPKDLTANAPEGQPYIVISDADLTVLINAGLGIGSMALMIQDPDDPTEALSDYYLARVISVDDTNNAIYFAAPVPKAYTTALNAQVQIIATGKHNKVTGLTAAGGSNTGVSKILQAVYQEDFSYDNIRGSDLPECLLFVYGCYATSHGDATCVGRGSSSLAAGSTPAAFQFWVTSGDTVVGKQFTEGTRWGHYWAGCHWGNWANIHGKGTLERPLKVSHCRHNNFSNLIGTDSLARAGITLSGDTHSNMFVNCQASGNYIEPGILLTPLGTNLTIENNWFVNVRSVNNNTTTTPEMNVYCGTRCGPNNHFLGEWGGPTMVTSLTNGNSFGHGNRFTQAFTAGEYTAESGTWTVATGEQSSTWSQQGKEMALSGYAITTSVSATPLYLKRALPNGRTCAVSARGSANIWESAATATPGFCTAEAGEAFIRIYKISRAVFATTADQTDVDFAIRLTVQ